MTSTASQVPGAAAVFTILEAAPTPVVAVEESGTIVYVNELAVDLFGYASDELVGLRADVLLPEDQRDEGVDNWDGFVTGARVRLIESEDNLFLRRRDGSTFPAEVSLTPLETEEGRLLAAAVRDITRRREREAEVLTLGRNYLALIELYQAIVRAPDEAALFSESCRIAVEHAGYLGAWVAVADEAGVVRRAAWAGEIDEFLKRLQVTLDPAQPEGTGPTAVALREGRPVFSSELPEDEALPWRVLANEYGIRAAATLPLRRDGRSAVVLTLYTDRADLLDEEMRTLVAAASENVSLALERFVAADRLRSVAAQRQELSQRLVVAQEEERARIAADVHDDSVQSLAAMDLRLGLLRRQVAEVAPELEAAVEQVQDTLVSVTAGLRDLLFDLESADTTMALSDLLREAADHVFEDTGVHWTVSVDPSGWDGRSTLSPTHRGQALRIAKEALINVRKHANAQHVLVRLFPGPLGVQVTVSDDGAGFDVDAVSSPKGHRGLASMRDRAAISGGWCRIESDGQGVTVRFWIPYDDSAPPWMAPGY